MSDKKVCKIEDDRIKEYTNRTRSGQTQVFYTGNDSRDWDRYKKEGGNSGRSVEMHDKPDTIKITPPKKSYYSELVDGEWWWVEGCAECNGRDRDWMTYVECDKHNVCRTCKTPRKDIKDIPWGGKNGWQCKPCADTEAAELKIEMLSKVSIKEYNEYNYWNKDKVVCPHCENSYSPDDGDPEDEQECQVCGGKFSCETEYSATYSTKVIGERVV